MGSNIIGGHISEVAGQKEIGEACTKNLQLPFVAPRIGDMLPEARLFVLCRNPVDRAISVLGQLQSRRGGAGLRGGDEKNLRRLETGPRFEDETEATLYARVASQGPKALQRAYGFYIEPGYYAEHIERYRALFGQDRMMIIFFEDLTRDAPGCAPRPSAFWASIRARFRRQGAESSHEPNRGSALLDGGQVAGDQAHPASLAPEVRRRIAERFGTKKPAISDGTRRMLLEHFRPHNERLAQLTGRNLDHWNQLAH